MNALLGVNGVLVVNLVSFALTFIILTYFFLRLFFTQEGGGVPADGGKLGLRPSLTRTVIFFPLGFALTFALVS